MSLHTLTAVLSMATQEDGAMPGPGLSATETFVTFVAVPVALFVVISLLAYALTGDRKKKSSGSSAITSID
jgi:hypothetical protein